MKNASNQTEEQRTGSWGERRAMHYLLLHGYTVKERNWRAGHREIDLIVSNLRDIVFVEVKTRIYASAEEMQVLAPPKHAVHSRKQQLTRQAAQQYLAAHPTNKQPRMDVIEISALQSESGKRPKAVHINHIKAAY